MCGVPQASPFRALLAACLSMCLPVVGCGEPVTLGSDAERAMPSPRHDTGDGATDLDVAVPSPGAWEPKDWVSTRFGARALSVDEMGRIALQRDAGYLLLSPDGTTVAEQTFSEEEHGRRLWRDIALSGAGGHLLAWGMGSDTHALVDRVELSTGTMERMLSDETGAPRVVGGALSRSGDAVYSTARVYIRSDSSVYEQSRLQFAGTQTARNWNIHTNANRPAVTFDDEDNLVVAASCVFRGPAMGYPTACAMTGFVDLYVTGTIGRTFFAVAKVALDATVLARSMFDGTHLAVEDLRANGGRIVLVGRLENGELVAGADRLEVQTGERPMGVVLALDGAGTPLWARSLGTMDALQQDDQKELIVDVDANGTVAVLRPGCGVQVQLFGADGTPLPLVPPIVPSSSCSLSVRDLAFHLDGWVFTGDYTDAFAVGDQAYGEAARPGVFTARLSR